MADIKLVEQYSSVALAAPDLTCGLRRNPEPVRNLPQSETAVADERGVRAATVAQLSLGMGK